MQVREQEIKQGLGDTGTEFIELRVGWWWHDECFLWGQEDEDEHTQDPA